MRSTLERLVSLPGLGRYSLLWMAVVLGTVTAVLSIDADGRQLVVVATPDRATARVFLAGTHTLTRASATEYRIVLKDSGTGSAWDGYEGLAESGPLAGQRLESAPAFVSYWFSWHSLFPDTRVGRR